MNISVKKVEPNSVLNDRLLNFVENSSWIETKKHTAKMIGEDIFNDWESMFVAMDGNKIVGHASFMKTDYYPLPKVFPWISTIFVDEQYRGLKISGLLIDYINGYAKKLGFERTYISSKHFGIYEKYGYEYIMDIQNYGGGNDHLFCKKI